MQPIVWSEHPVQSWGGSSFSMRFSATVQNPVAILKTFSWYLLKSCSVSFLTDRYVRSYCCIMYWGVFLSVLSEKEMGKVLKWMILTWFTKVCSRQFTAYDAISKKQHDLFWGWWGSDSYF